MPKKKRAKSRAEKKTAHADVARDSREKLRGFQKQLTVLSEDGAWVVAEAKRLGVTNDLFKTALKRVLERYREKIPDALPTMECGASAAKVEESTVTIPAPLRAEVASAGSEKTKVGNGAGADKRSDYVTRDIGLKLAPDGHGLSDGSSPSVLPGSFVAEGRLESSVVGVAGKSGGAQSPGEVVVAPDSVPPEHLAWEPVPERPFFVAIQETSVWLRGDGSEAPMPALEALRVLAKAETVCLVSRSVFRLGFSNSLNAVRGLNILNAYF
jgi:hypothetical protein